MLPYISAEEAVQVVKSGDRVFIHGGASTPLLLLKTLQEQRSRYENVEITSVSMQGDVKLTEADRGHLFVNSLFVSAAARASVNNGMGDYIPIFLSEIPQLFNRNILPIDVAFIHVSVPDKHGYCTLGVSIDVVRAALGNAKYIIAQVNPRMPRTHGDSAIHTSKFNAMVWSNQELPEVSYATDASDEVSNNIGKYCASLIEDGATLQMGIGTIQMQC